MLPRILLVYFGSAIMFGCAYAKPIYDDRCFFRVTYISNDSGFVQYQVGRDKFSEREILALEGELRRYQVEHERAGKKILIPCEVYGDFDFLHNISKKAGVGFQPESIPEIW